VASVIQSCVPGIKNAWKTPAIDLTAILIAIRIATYGSDMDVTSSCPACQIEGEYTLDLHTLLSGAKHLDFSKAVKHGDLEIYFKSIDYQTQNTLNTQQFEQQRIIQAVQQSSEPEEQKLAQINNALKEITKLTILTIQHSIAGIRTPSAFVTEPEFIEDFLNNCDRTVFTTIRDHVIQMREDSDLPPMPVTCTECKHEYTQTITLDSTSFFAAAS
jgi:hypothetical protein